jgi:hypothetical protein
MFQVVFIFLYCVDYACLVWSVLSMVCYYLVICYDVDLCMYTQFPVIVVDVVYLRWYLTPEDDPVKGSKHVANTSYAIKTNVDTIVSILFH